MKSDKRKLWNSMVKKSNRITKMKTKPTNIVHDILKDEEGNNIAEVRSGILCIYLKNMKDPIIRLLDSNCPDNVWVLDPNTNITEPPITAICNRMIKLSALSEKLADKVRKELQDKKEKYDEN